MMGLRIRVGSQNPRQQRQQRLQRNLARARPPQPWIAAVGLCLLGVPLPAQAQSIPSGAKSVKIIFKQGSNGSFGAVSASTAVTGLSTTTTPDLTGGYEASTFFTTDATPASMTRPNWLTGVSVTLAGSSNTGALNPACGSFASTNAGSNDSDCGFDSNLNCNGPVGFYRVSEADCANLISSGAGAAIAGTGLSSDPVAVKIFLNRSTAALGSTENLLLVIEYQASGLLGSPTNPGNCVDTNTGLPLWSNDCADQAYTLYARTRNSNDAIRLQTLIPPQGGRVIGTPATAPTSFTFGGPIQTKQIIVPLSTLTGGQNVIQLSRSFGLTHGGLRNFSSYCLNPSGGGNTPLCLGLVLYSISIFRI
ncbi:MAG: hypothetical protein ACK5QT_02570 [Oligoflexia bacterium]